jgi:hypothetical protein
LEQEKETEVEIQIQIIRQSELDWDYSVSLAHVLRVEISFQSSLGISWPRNLYCTKNFVRSLSNSRCKFNNYLRPVDALLCAGKDIILISERELNNLWPVAFLTLMNPPFVGVLPLRWRKK